MNQDYSFAPIERLMEFGMSMAVANQMVQTMNEVMAKANKPSLQNIGLQHQVPKSYYVVINDITQGPFSESEISGHILSDKITEDTFVWHDGMSNWQLTKDVPEVAKLFLLKPPKF
jgi:hypothetical protein